MRNKKTANLAVVPLFTSRRRIVVSPEIPEQINSVFVAEQVGFHLFEGLS
jgi:biotin transporter BioY